MPEISVILCTYNRAPNLPECFEHLDRQAGAETIDWELVVVDNNSADDTAATVERLAAKVNFPVRYLFEGKQGLSHARNCGIDGSDSPFVVFIDDDIRVEPGWIKAIHDTFSEKQCDAVGGPIHVVSPQDLPKWILPEMYGFLGHIDYGDQIVQLDGVDRFPFGGNMAFRRAALESVGRFNPELGRKGEGGQREELFKGEETDFFARLASQGGEIWYNPQAGVSHKILPYQLKRRFFLTIHYNEGYLLGKLDPHSYPRTLLGIPLFVFPQSLRALGNYLGLTLKKGPDHSVRQLMTVAYFAGKMRGYADKRKQKT